jgi:hypothetical protein
MATVQYIGDGGPDGVQIRGGVLGTSATDTIGFYGVATPVAQRASSVQATSNVTAYTSTTASALIGAFLVEVANTLNGLGIWKGSA